MKKSKYYMLLTGTSLLIIIAAIIILVINTEKDDKRRTNGLSADVSVVQEDTEKSIESDESAIETIEEDGYTILLKGSARPKNDEIAVEEAARIGVEEINKKYQLNEKDYSVEMFFLDGIVSKSGSWSGHIVLSDKEKYEFLLDGKDGNIEFINKYD